MTRPATPAPATDGPRSGPDGQQIVLVAAIAQNGVIGRDGGMPWHIPGEQQHFKAVTMGHPMIMGRRTFQSIGRALPGRRSIVLTRRTDWAAEGVEVAADLDQALAMAGPGRVMIVGGGQVYREAMPIASELELTLVHDRFDGDTQFPTIEPDQWQVTVRRPGERYDLVSYCRRSDPA